MQYRPRRRPGSRVGVERRWRAWLLVFQLTLLADLAQVSQGWALAFFVPLVNLVVSAWLWGRIFKRTAIPAGWALVMWMPFVNAPILAYAASRGDAPAAHETTHSGQLAANRRREPEAPMSPEAQVNAERFWRAKTDEALAQAKTQLAEYTPAGRRIILAELRRRVKPEVPRVD